MAKTNSGLLEFKDAQKVLIALDDATSEVKKAVIIDADGVETNIQGVQPTGKKEITSTAEVNVANYATAQVVDEDLVAGNIKKDVDILGVVGSYEGGGGSSDFSTAEVTINWDASEPDAELLKDNCPMIYRNDSDEKAPYIQGLLSATTSPVVVEVPLYKGKCYWDILHRGVTVTGNIEELGYGYLITGDCTINITHAQ